MNKYNKIVFVNGSAPALNADNLNHMDEGIEQATDGAIALESEIATARGGQNSLGARLDTTDANLANKADKTSTLAGYGIVNAYTKTEMLNLLAKKEDNSNKVSSKTDITDSSTNYPSVKYLNDYYYDANESYSSKKTDELLGNKADLVNSSNIFDFDAWAKGLQGLTNPVFNGTLNNVDYNEKSISFTTTEIDAHTNGWNSSAPQSMRIAVKPNTKYLFSWLPSSTNSTIYGAHVLLNGVNTAATNFLLKSGFGSFTTAEDTNYISICFNYYGVGFFKVSEIMITEKESIYLSNRVAEGVPEVANEVLTFEKTTQTSLDGKYDSANIESGTSILTPYSTVTDKIKSANCTYKTIGDIVIVSATVKMNAVSLGGNSMCPLIDLPYKCISEDNVFCVGISNLGKLFKFAIPKNNTWLQFSTQDKTVYTFADGEQINVICLYKIK